MMLTMERAAPRPVLRGRPNTQDLAVIQQVLASNEYRLPERFDPLDVIVDVGAHLGSFARACLERGAQEIWCYEPDAENFHLLQENLQPFAERVLLHQQAVWGGAKPAPRTFSGYANGWTAGGTLLQGVGPCGWNEERPVATVGFNAVLRRASQEGGRRITLLKLDCEGAEFALLYQCDDLACVDAIVGELHPWRSAAVQCNGADLNGQEATAAAFGACLERHGFTVELVPQDSNVLFFAQRGSDA